MIETKKPRVLSVFGTRPEAIKMGPLVRRLSRDARFDSAVCVTGQHRQMLDQVLRAFDITPEWDLAIMKPGQDLDDITSAVLLGMKAVIDAHRPDLVLVHGDTTTSFAAALAAFYRRVPVGHVEAGLRTGDLYSPFPEEANRCLTGRIAALHFAPTRANAENLRREGITENIFITGNTVIDALRHTVRDDYAFAARALAGADLSGRVLLLTVHRRENLGRPMCSIFAAVRALVDRYPDARVVYPVHPNPAVREPAYRMLNGHPRILLTEPLDMQDMHNLMARSHLILTDSGGLQEEAPALGKPVLVLRTETERPEAVQAGTVRVVGVETDAILSAACGLLDDEAAYARMAAAVNPYGDGHAARRIADAIAAWFEGGGARRPGA